MSNPWVQPDPCGLGWTYVIGWVGLNFFLNYHDGLGQKNPLNPTHAHPYLWLGFNIIELLSSICRIANISVTSWPNSSTSSSVSLRSLCMLEPSLHLCKDLSIVQTYKTRVSQTHIFPFMFENVDIFISLMDVCRK